MIREIFREIIGLLSQIDNVILGTALLFLILIIICFMFWSGNCLEKELYINGFKNSSRRGR